MPDQKATRLRDLKESTREPTNLWVRFDKEAGKAYVVNGECRLRACLELIAEGVPIKSIPVVQVSVLFYLRS
jgi:hypothetical protein